MPGNIRGAIKKARTICLPRNSVRAKNKAIEVPNKVDPKLKLKAINGLRCWRGHDPGVVDQDVQASAPSLDGSVHQSPALVRVGDVGGDRDDALAQRRLADRVFLGLGIDLIDDPHDVADSDLPPLPGQRVTTARSPDALEDPLVHQLLHDLFQIARLLDVLINQASEFLDPVFLQRHPNLQRLKATAQLKPVIRQKLARDYAAAL